MEINEQWINTLDELENVVDDEMEKHVVEKSEEENDP